MCIYKYVHVRMFYTAFLTFYVSQSQHAKAHHHKHNAGTTISAYRHEGMRLEDFKILIRQNYDSLAAEVGKMARRPSSLRWCEWVTLAGGRVRGTPSNDPKEIRAGKDTRFAPNSIFTAGGGDNCAGFAGMVGEREAQKERAEIDSDHLNSIWPLHMVDFKDTEQIMVLFKLLRRVPQVIEWFLCNHVLPLTMRFQASKLSASGQEVSERVCV